MDSSPTSHTASESTSTTEDAAPGRSKTPAGRAVSPPRAKPGGPLAKSTKDVNDVKDATRTADTSNAVNAADAVDAITEQWAAVRPDLDTAPMAVYGRIYRIARAMGDLIEKEYARFGVSRGEFDVLATLRRAGEPYTLSPRDLSATLMLTTGGMTGRLDRLERAGLLTRNPCPDDRRALRVTLTDRGLELADKAVTAGLARQHEMSGAALDPAEADQLAALLRKLLSVHE